MSNNTGNTLLAVLAGVAIGAGLGILYAPDKGSKTRGKLKDGFDDAKNDLQNKFDTVSSQLNDKLTTAKFDLEDSYEDLVSNMSHKTEEVISFLEDKLAELKRQNAKFQK
ncbi:YtxH domain-containing protein [Flavobacterium petrolei]|jgi:gas vesicle protein|uniref:YtxH domain-containing protein n=1 Tax=Flavobacterium petrolei TaxID=2259594 RepID=A0A482TZ59_9FLAO|nr:MULTISPECIES: YtxH domain-containing protein [Flavobacterium]QIH38978.1 YtxH domain-containing protein [Flavobacterium sp. Sr18]RYJ53274.1 YtxH domain-containing protein [Flavobacterium petrolei]